jgi:oligoribonuclease NrnB/cAMP/cGMP phosphodiesterase (DHH superfamily)
VGLEEASATLKAQIDMCSSEGDDKFVFSQAQRYLIDSYKRRRETMLEKVGSRAKKAPILINNKMYKAIIFIPDEEVGNAESEKLYRDYPDMDFVVALYPKNRALSFRASESSTTDVSVIAASLGGGGHEKAAGASLSTDDFIKWLRVYYDYKDEQE